MEIRLSNFELLRLVAMTMVLVIHVFIGISRPSQADTFNFPLQSLSFYAVNAFTIICVNLFILISGWFGINLKLAKLGELIFQVLFFSTLIFFSLALYCPEKYFNVESLSTIFMLNSNDYWFVKAYIGLCLFSPILNLFISHIDRNQYKLILFLLFGLQTIYGWLSIDGANWIAGGYSVYSFICLYLLARYAKLYGCQIRIRRIAICNIPIKIYISIFCLIVLTLTLAAYFLTWLGLPFEGRLFTYTNPLVVLESLVFLCIFKNFHLQNKWINKIALSSMAIYLLHGNELILRPMYSACVQYIYNNYDGVTFIFYLTIFLLSIAVLALLLDQIRLYIYHLLFHKRHDIYSNG
ncbi:MAG: acyltransferase family protein [Prevotella sp.]|nr:acyltransferase family protein [Prevotella sp.]